MGKNGFSTLCGIPLDLAHHTCYKPCMETSPICEILKKEFIKKCQTNPQYSIRGYAKFLGVDHSLLSKIIRGQHKLSKKMAFKVGEKLGLTINEINKSLQDQSEKALSQQISDDVFIVMSDWYHFAILELIKTESFSSSIDKIADSLAISKLEAEMAIERLLRLGFIKKNDEKLQLERVNNQWFDHEQSNEARKILQKQFLRKAIVAVDETPFNERINSSLTIAIDKSKMNQFREQVKSIIVDFEKISEENQKERVYQLCVAFYPLSEER